MLFAARMRLILASSSERSVELSPRSVDTSDVRDSTGRWLFILASIVLVALAVLILRAVADGPYRSCHPYDPRKHDSCSIAADYAS